MYYIKFYIVFFAAFFVTTVFSQNPVIEEMNKISNLPDVEFYDVKEDAQKYIWLAANKGLYRYNGKSYKRFSHPKQKSNSLFQLKLDHLGQLWCNNLYGQLFYVKNNKLQLFYDASQFAKGQLFGYVINLKTIRLFTTTGIYDIDKITRKPIKISDGLCISNANDEQMNYVFVVNSENDLNNNITFKIDNLLGTNIVKIESFKNIQSPKLFGFKNHVFFTHKINNDNVLYIINKDKKTKQKLITPNELKDKTIYNLLNFKGNYWFLTTSGVYIYQLKNYKLVFKDHIFKNESITDVEIDFNNNYWFTTLDNGVFVSPNLNIRQVNLKSLVFKITASCNLNNNEFVLGTNDGKLFFYNTQKQFKTIQLPSKKIVGKLFFDTQKEQLIVSINATESFTINLKNYKITDTGSRFSVAKTFSKINDTLLFYGNYKEGILYNNPFKLKEKKILGSNRVKTSIVYKSSLLVAYINGFFQYDLDTFNQKEIKINEKSLLVNAITKSANTVWLTTQHNGFLKLTNDTLTQVKLGLPKNVQINAIKSDRDYLWISTDTGLYQHNTLTNTFKLLNAQDGINTAVNNFLILKDYIVITLPKSFYVLPKEKGLFKTFKTAKVIIKKIIINDKDTLVKPQYKLPFNFNRIGVHFNSNGFQSNKHVAYQYRIKSIDTSWHQIPLNTQTINFNSLSSGKHKIELKAKNISAKKAVYAPSISFIISKPFWQSWWFYLIILLIIFTSIWLYFWWSSKRKEAKRNIEIDKILIDKKITHLRLENLRSQMNPHFIFNALNSIQDYIISNKKDLASSYLVKFSRLIRIYLDYSQQNEITLQEELNALKLYLELEKIRFEDELEYRVQTEQQVNTKNIKVPPLFIQPYVENALKHGLLHKSNNRKLQVIIKKKSDTILEITIEDNGIGRIKSQEIKQSNHQHKSFATKANEERVYLYKTKLKKEISVKIIDLYNKNKEATGTKVIIKMSIPKYL